MSSSIQTNASHYSYSAKDPELLRAKADKLLSVFLPDGLLNAVVNERGESIFINYYRAPEGLLWDSNFYEEKLNAEMYARNATVRKMVFAGADRQLLVPESLYQYEAASAAYRNIFFQYPEDALLHTYCRADKAQLLVNINQVVKEAGERCVGNADPKPANYFQFYSINRQRGAVVDCLLTSSNAYCTLRNNDQLIWHQVVAYIDAKDVVFHLLHALRELKMNKEAVELLLTSVSPGLYDRLEEIDSFFNGTALNEKSDTIPAEWLPVTRLIQQLSKCVS